MALMAFLMSIVFVANAQQGPFNQSPSSGLEEGKVQVYPNPTLDGYINIVLENVENIDPKIEVRNVIGSEIKITSISRPRQNEYRLEITDCPPGYYLLTVRDEKSGFLHTVKFSKK